MTDIYGTYFEFGGVSSKQYGLIIASLDTSRNTALYGSKTSISVFNKLGNKRYLVGDDYTSSPLSFDIEVITEDTFPIESAQKRIIEKWLFSHKDFRKMYFNIENDCDNESFESVGKEIKRYYLNCRFINPQKIESDIGVVGYRATLEADSDMFWEDPTTQTFSSGEEESISNISVHVDTDSQEYVHPKVTIKMGSTGGDFTIVNNSDDSTRITKFIGVSKYATIVMNSSIRYVSGEYYEKFYNRNFIRLIDGDNDFHIIGDISSITVEWQNRRFL